MLLDIRMVVTLEHSERKGTGGGCPEPRTVLFHDQSAGYMGSAYKNELYLKKNTSVL